MVISSTARYLRYDGLKAFCQIWHILISNSNGYNFERRASPRQNFCQKQQIDNNTALVHHLQQYQCISYFSLLGDKITNKQSSLDSSSQKRLCPHACAFQLGCSSQYRCQSNSQLVPSYLAPLESCAQWTVTPTESLLSALIFTYIFTYMHFIYIQIIISISLFLYL